MASSVRSTNPTLVAERYAAVERHLRKDPWSFQFFQAVRLLEKLHPNRSPVGRFVHPSKEMLRFSVPASTAFPASAIQELQWRENGPPLMVVNFMGLTGPQGLLPLYYSELIRERVRQKDRTLIAFFDLFNHRMISLFYQAWEKYRFTVAYERGERDRFSHHLLDIIGLGTQGLQDRQSVADDSLLFYSGLFALKTRSAVTLERILQDYFDAPIAVEQFVGAWQPISADDQCCFNEYDSFSEQLGIGAVVGDEVWDQNSRVRIRIGPLPLARYIEFLPDGSAFQPMRAMTRFYAGDEIEFDMQLILKRDEVPACELNLAMPTGSVVPQLGWSTWAKTAPMGYDPGDTILSLS